MNFEIAKELMMGSATGLAIGIVLLALIIVIFGKAIVETRQTDKERTKWKSIVFALRVVLLLLTMAPLLFTGARSFMFSLFKSPQVILMLVNLLLYSIWIAPSVLSVRSHLRETFPKYAASLEKSAIASFVTYSILFGILSSLGHRVVTAVRQPRDVIEVLPLAAIMLSLARLGVSLSGSFADLARVELLRETGYVRGIDIEKINKAFQDLITRPAAAWALPVILSILGAMVHKSLGDIMPFTQGFGEARQ